MHHYIILGISLLGHLASGQVGSSFPSSPLPTTPAVSQTGVGELIGNIPTCWQGCVGGAIKVVCPSDDSWACACNAYFNPQDRDFVQLAAYDPVCHNCSQTVGLSDGGVQGELRVGVASYTNGARMALGRELWLTIP
jgi:hypothetical protein